MGRTGSVYLLLIGTYIFWEGDGRIGSSNHLLRGEANLGPRGQGSEGLSCFISLYLRVVISHILIGLFGQNTKTSVILHFSINPFHITKMGLKLA